MEDFGRLITAMVTPMSGSGAVNYETARKLARKLADSGSEGVVVSGTTGESPTLSREEKLRLLDVVLEEVGDRICVIAGTGTNCTRQSIELSKDAERAGAHGVMVVTPYYNKPPQEGLFQHFKTVAESVSIPVMIYNVPGRTGVNILPETVIRLAEVPNITSIKEASGNMEQISNIIRSKPSDFRVYSGDDSLTLPILSIGGHGVVSVASHVVGPQMSDMIKAHLCGDFETASRIHCELTPLFKALFIAPNPIMVKKALQLTGLEVGLPRLPLVPPSEGEVIILKRELENLGLGLG